VFGLNGKGKGREDDLPEEVVEEMNEMARAFERKGEVVKRLFGVWLKKAMDQAAYVEACKRSEAYREKIRAQGQGSEGKALVLNQNGTTPDKKRRISLGQAAMGESPARKRARRKVPATYQKPVTDEELAARFKEVCDFPFPCTQWMLIWVQNHEEHERRWAQGSFLQVVRRFFDRHTSEVVLPSYQQLWLSLNPETDATAIWLETKLDVPKSGKWASETVFAIPLEHQQTWSGKSHPGLIMFECTPLEAVEDEIERYVVLVECGTFADCVTGNIEFWMIVRG